MVSGTISFSSRLINPYEARANRVLSNLKPGQFLIPRRS
jgi:hypothetical protein